MIYVDHSDDLSAERFPFNHPRAACWVRRAGSRWKLYICTYEVPGGLPSHREQIARELIAVYHPSCNPEQYDSAWKDEWIGEYTAPTTGPLTTSRDPGLRPARLRTSRPSGAVARRRRAAATGAARRPAVAGPRSTSAAGS